MQFIECGDARNKEVSATIVDKQDCTFPGGVMVTCDITIEILFFIHRRCQVTEVGRSQPPFFGRYLNPPSICKMHKSNICAYCIDFHII